MLEGRHQSPAAILGRLTAKELVVLEGLSNHQTSKEIARDLGVAKNTVDMRLRTARDKLGARDRKDLARLYESLRETCDRVTCDSVVIPGPSLAPLTAPLEPDHASQFVLQDAATFTGVAPWVGERDGFPEDLDRRFGPWWRVASIVLITLAIALVVLALFSIANTMGAMF